MPARLDLAWMDAKPISANMWADSTWGDTPTRGCPSGVRCPSVRRARRHCRGTVLVRAPSAGRRAPCWPPRVLPPAGASTCCVGSGTRSSPASPSGGATRRVRLAQSSTGSASCRTSIRVGTPGCAKTPCASSSSGRHFSRRPAPSASPTPSGCAVASIA